jgi:hypothetical protein
VDQARAGDGTGIDHRIERMVLRIEADRVEGVARWFDADRAFDPCGAQRIQCQREHERLRHRLDGEGNPGIADFVDVTVEGGEADAEMIGVGLAEFMDIVGNGSAGLLGKISVTIVEEPPQRRFRSGPAMVVLGRGRSQTSHVSSCSAMLFALTDITLHRDAPKPVGWRFMRQAVRRVVNLRSRERREPVPRQRHRRVS